MIRFAGYAALFDRPDRSGDVIRAGAFGAPPPQVPLLWEHGAAAGRVARIGTDAIGLWIAAESPRPIRPGHGLSIGYRVRAARRRQIGRELIDLELVEISLVRLPMQPLARVTAVGEEAETPLPLAGGVGVA